jgi:hypothetical protein
LLRKKHGYKELAEKPEGHAFKGCKQQLLRKGKRSKVADKQWLWKGTRSRVPKRTF